MSGDDESADPGKIMLNDIRRKDRSRGRRLGQEATLFDELTACYHRVLLWEQDEQYSKEDLIKAVKDTIAVLLTKCLVTPQIGSMFAHNGDELEAIKMRVKEQQSGFEVGNDAADSSSDTEDTASAARKTRADDVLCEENGLEA